MKTKRLAIVDFRKTVKSVIAFLLLFCSALCMTLNAQSYTHIWNGNTGNWNDLTNWYGSDGTTPAASLPAAGSLVQINSGICTIPGVYAAVGKVFVGNTDATTLGKLIINGTLTSSAAGNSISAGAIVINGGIIENNGILTASATNATLGYSIRFENPSIAPSIPWGYLNGTGTLNLNSTAATTSGGAILFNNTNTLATQAPQFDLKNATTTYTITGSPTGLYALTVAAGANAIIGGTGLTLGSSGTPAFSGLISQSGNNSVLTINSSTTLTCYGSSNVTSYTLTVPTAAAATSGATYTSGSYTYTVTTTKTTNNGTTLAVTCSVAGGAPATGTLTRTSASGTGDATINFSASYPIASTYGVYLNSGTSGTGSADIKNLTFTNYGTINVYGVYISALRAGFGTYTNINMNNNANAIFNTDMAATTAFNGAMTVDAGAAVSTSTLALTNAGKITLKNSAAAGTYVGYALCCSKDPNQATITFDNSGVLEFSGNYLSTGGAITSPSVLVSKTTINNTGTITMLSGGLDKTIVNNNSGGILDCKTNTVTSATTYYVVSINSGSTLKTAVAGGLTCIGGSGAVFNAGANYEFNGSSAQTTGSALTAANNLTVNNSAGVTLSANITVNAALALTTGTLTVGANTLTINGTVPTRTSGNIDASNGSATVAFTNASGFSLPASLFSGNVNNLTINGGGITLGSATTVNGMLTLTAGTLTTGGFLTLGNSASITRTAGSLSAAPTFGTSVNLTYNNTSAQTTSFELPTTASVLNSLTINNPAGVTLSANSTLKSTLTLTAGTLTLNGKTLTINGPNIIRTAGSLSAAPNFNTSVNLTYNNTSAQTTSYELPAVALNKLNSLTINNPAGVTLGANSTLKTTLTLTAGTLTVGANTLTIAGTVPTLTSGNIDASNAGATVAFTNASGFSLPANLFSGNINNLTINGTGGVTLGGATTVAGSLALTAGTLTVGANTLTIAGSVPTLTSGNIDASNAGATVAFTNASGFSLPANLFTANVNNLTINGSGVTLGSATTVAGSLALTAGTLTTGTYLTLTTGASIIKSAGSLSAAPTYGSAINLTYNGTSTKGNEFPATDIINTLTANNTAGITLSDNRTIPNLTIGSGSSLTVNAGQQLTVSSSLSNSGTLNLLTDNTGAVATIITPTTLGGSGGVYSVNQYLGTARNWYVSSPVASTTSTITNMSKYFEYIEAGTNTVRDGQPSGSSDYWKGYDPGYTMIAGKGYIALPSTTGASLTFNGTLNSGDVSVDITSSGSRFNLIGNPYPCHIAWTQAYTTSKSAQIEPSIYVRTNSGGSNSTGWSFATYNATTGIAVPNQSLLAGGIIPPMQAFWVRANASAVSPLVLTSDLTRSHQSSNPLKAPANKNSERQLVRLEVSNGIRTDETLLLFDANANDSYDAYDSPKYMEANSEVQIFTTIDTKKLVMNGMRNLPLNQEIKLGFIPGNATSFSLKAKEITNLPADVKLILIDNAKAVETDLTDGVSSYTFSSETFSGDRFSILFRSPSSPNDVENVTKLNAQVFVNAANQITIIAPEKATYSIYNAMGQKMDEGKTTSNHQTTNSKLSPGVYLVRVSNDGKELTSRVIIK